MTWRGDDVMYCPKCGSQLPDESLFCMKCGAKMPGSGAATTESTTDSSRPVIAPMGATALKCPNCGAPINPQFGEMVVTCEYCGSGITLGSDGWKGVQKQTMLPLRFAQKDQMVARIGEHMDKGLLHRHLQESSTLEEMNLSLVPYWIISASARTSIVASDLAAEAGQIATTAAVVGLLGAAMGGMGGRRSGGFAGPLMMGTMMGSTMGATSGGGQKKSYDIAGTYNFPVVALKALFDHQPKDYEFNLDERELFDVSKVSKDVKILNGDVGEEGAKSQAKMLVTQLQSDKAHSQYHMIQQLHTEVEVGDAELLHAPIWFARYDYKGKKVSLVIDANTGNVINSIGL